MREILFRGKRVNNGEWIYGDYHFYSLQNFIIPRGKHEPIKVIAETVSQYTGLTDKNGARIFEGDILKSVSEIYSDWGTKSTGGYKTSFLEVVVSDDDAFTFGTKEINSDFIDTCFLKVCCKKFYEIIGNIHDNPELMEELK